MSSVRTTTSQSNASLEAFCHFSEEFALRSCGDNEFESAAEWPASFDLWLWATEESFQPSIEEQQWAAEEFGSLDEGIDKLVAYVLDCEKCPGFDDPDPDTFRTPEERAEYEAFLDSIAPTDAELDARYDREDSWSLGHQP